MEIVHYSVLKEEVCDYLKPDTPNQLLIDGTMGEGGHSEMFLTRFSDLNVIGLDADREIQQIAKKRLAAFAPAQRKCAKGDSRFLSVACTC